MLKNLWEAESRVATDVSGDCQKVVISGETASRRRKARGLLSRAGAAPRPPVIQIRAFDENTVSLEVKEKLVLMIGQMLEVAEEKRK